jgi:RNA polymerase sigma factor (sigma-70 family)
MGIPAPPKKSEMTSHTLQMCERRVSEAVSEDDLEQHGISHEELVRYVTGIVSRNVASGRARGGTAGQSTEGEEKSLSETYIDRVVDSYLQEHDRVEALAAQDEAAWTELLEQLTGRAYSILLRLQVPSGRARGEAADFAQETCEVIFNHPFPYDVSFDAWATRILKNRILWQYTRSQDLIDRESRMLSLDRPGQSETGDDFSLYDLLTDDSGTSAFERLEVREWLIQAVACLRSRGQQQVIFDTFFYELSDEEIAKRLGRTRQAVYNLRHRALQGLKEILERRKKGR